MNKLDIKLGGHPLTKDDLHFLRDSLAGAINGIAESLYGSFCILSGCELTITGGSPPYTVAWTAGWIYLNGEICKIDAGTHNNWDGSNRFTIVQTTDPAGDLVYESLVTESTYIIRKATIDNGGYGSTNGLEVYAALRFKDTKKFTTITPLGSWGWGGGIAVGTSLSPVGEVVFRGAAIIASYNTGSDTKICTLAAQFRPQEKRTFLCAAIIATVKTFIHVEVDLNGDVMPLGLTSTQAATIFLDGIRLVKGIA